MPSIDQLHEVVQRCDRILAGAPAVLRPFANTSTHSFHANSTSSNKTSVTSTAFCIFPLIEDRHLLRQFITLLPGNSTEAEYLGAVAQAILDTPWKSEDLEEDNLYTAPIALYCLSQLASTSPKAQAALERSASRLEKSISQVLKLLDNNAARIRPYEPSGFLNYWSIAALTQPVLLSLVGKDVKTRSQEAVRHIESWASNALAKQIAFHSAGDDGEFDPSQLAYLVALKGLGCWHEDHSLRFLIPYAWGLLRNAQQRDGLWPQSHPIFHYKERGSVYSFSCEMFDALFRGEYEGTVTLDWLPVFTRLLDWIERSKLKSASYEGWRSNLLPPTGVPEAWSTGAALLSVLRIKALSQQWLNAAIFAQFPGQDCAPRRGLSDPFAPESFADCNVSGLKDSSLVKNLKFHLIEPRLKPEMEDNRRSSVVLFGPPGTAKTTIAKKVAESLNWPFLYLSTSDFASQGLDHVSGRAREVFSMLGYLDKVVVLFDEVEEFVRDRSDKAIDAKSRLITTSMLSLLQDLREKDRVIFFVATNHLDKFDPAVTRAGGRFDALLCVSPPSIEYKRKMLADAAKKGKSIEQEAAIDQILSEWLVDGTTAVAEHFAYTEWKGFVSECLPLIERRLKEAGKAVELAKEFEKLLKSREEGIANRGEVLVQYMKVRDTSKVY